MEELDIEKINILKMTYPRESIYYKVLEKLLQAYKQDEKVIEEMAKHIDTYTYRDSRDDYGCDFEMQTKCTCNYKDCNKCIIDYFRKKCE